VTEASLLGLVVTAAYGARLYPSLQVASKAMVTIAGAYHPNRERHGQYQFYAQKYREVYQQIKSVMHDVTRHMQR
jgi:sugar (pentulose or hexulose) kinase